MSIAPTIAPTASVRVLVAVDPFLLRTALHQVLARDDRFEVLLHPADTPVPPVAGCQGCPPVVLTTRPLDVRGVCVVAVDPATGDVHVDGDGPYAEHRYEDLDTLAELLHRVLVDRGLVPLPARGADSAQPMPPCQRGD